ncbi:hypothetical protein ACN47E_006478 [Coniothyrium glycines]
MVFVSTMSGRQGYEHIDHSKTSHDGITSHNHPVHRHSTAYDFNSHDQYNNASVPSKLSLISATVTDIGAEDYAFRSEPSEGDGIVVWFCSGCGDGPKGDWQNCCTGCGHVRSTCCKQETTPK